MAVRALGSALLVLFLLFLLLQGVFGERARDCTADSAEETMVDLMTAVRSEGTAC